MPETILHSVSQQKVEAKIDFVVNEFSRIQVPPQKKADPQEFREMSTIQKQLILKRLIEHVHEL